MSAKKSYAELPSENLVDKILEQGQRLRNSMVQSILNNDPLNAEIIFNTHYNTPVNSSIDLCGMKNVLHIPTTVNEDKIDMFLKGDAMNKDDERLALDTLRSMSAADLCKTTNKIYCSNQNQCNCATCTEYYDSNRYFNVNKNYNDQFVENYENVITKQIQETYRNENRTFLKFVDSLKVSIHSLILNEAGNRKVGSTSNIEDKNRLPLNQTYFLEYRVPDILVRNIIRTKSKVDTGLENNNVVRICSRRRFNEAITFKQVFIHDIENVNELNLSTIDLTFQISCRNPKQKAAITLGSTKFNFNNFEISKNLTCNRALVIGLNNTPIEIGVLKVSLQLGCGRLYFGKEFLDAISLNRKHSATLESDDSACLVNNEESARTINVQKEYSNLKEPRNKKFSSISNREKIIHESEPKPIQRHSNSASNSAYFINSPKKSKRLNLVESKITPAVSEKHVLFGFLYISEAQYLCPPITSYITVRPFCQDNNAFSRTVSNSLNPVFNFCQIVPLVCENELLYTFRENYMLIEFWRKSNEKDVVIGITKIPLHQFYLAYRNTVIIKYLQQNKLPIIGTDWWEPILAPIDDGVVGQVQILVALGTEQQIKNLESERGFKNNIVKSQFYSPTKSDTNKSIRFVNEHLEEKVNKNKPIVNKIATPRETLKSPKAKKVDIGTQSSFTMDKNNDIPGVDALGTFLNQLMQQPKTVLVENSTNTETFQDSNSDDAAVKETADLLEKLEKVLSVDVTDKSLSNHFKANIIIDSALHLPSRKKSKSKKTKNKSGNKAEDNILPSTYVTFETSPGGEMKFTPIVSKSTRPKWGFTCDVNLPVDLLTNSNNRLIFKVWRKSASTVKQPNLQTDIVLGFAAIDLTVLLAGLPNVQGWFNITDFSRKCNGQINIHVTPLEDVMKFHNQKEILNHHSPTPQQNIAEHQDNAEEPGQLLSRALKRKFTELDEITQRLRLRLSKVTNDESDNSNDEIADEFEHDINTLCIEEDFNLINFSEETKKDANNILKNDPSQALLLNNGESSENSEIVMEICDNKTSTSNQLESVSEASSLNSAVQESNATSLDKHLYEGKQRIDTLLEKLCLMSSNDNNTSFASRYISGCSTSNENNSNIDTEAILQKLDDSSRPNIHSGSYYDSKIFQQIYSSRQSESTDTSQITTPHTSNSETSVISNLSDCRAAPDGQGNISDDKVLKQND